MCWYVYIATSKPIENLVWRPNPEEGPPPLLHFELLSDDPERRDNIVRPMFKAPHLYYVGSSSGCSCHLDVSPDYDEETGDVLSPCGGSAQALIDFIHEYTLEEPLELYAVWEDAWEEGNAQQPNNSINIDVSGLNYDNYPGLESRLFYTFFRPL
jgi:hypothetical protein